MRSHLFHFDWMKRNVLVTGASGFQGAYLCDFLTGLGASVTGVVNSRTHPDSAYELLALGRKIVEARVDVADRQQVFDLINAVKPGVVFHLAAKAIVTVCHRDPYRAYLVNTLGTLNVVEACRQLRCVERLHLCSTDHVFGPVGADQVPLPEDSPLRYGATYESSKAAAEIILRSYHRTYGPELPLLCVTRSANVVGFGDTNQRRVLPAFLHSAMTTGEIPLTTRRNGRQFVPVTDAVAGYLLAVSRLDGRDATDNGDVATYHFSIEEYEESPEPFLRIGPLANKVAACTGARVVESPGCVDYIPHENPVQGLHCGRTRAELGWQPKAFDDALLELIEWYRPSTTRQRRRGLIRAAADAAVLRLLDHGGDTGELVHAPAAGDYVAAHAVTPCPAS